ncbi:BamA/TamA family outer membrane protein [Pseudobacter ginsenosidimutans]|uniref:Outer membrane protein assembly factor BamA n=1 Tax=Pseudobacter ginsenosidimutans TaxID=661488 RepID=A0A4Q7MYP6_9BACT|nr:BamA/TamA family outer membrane protein [Pseudobacter ginsenosidimutans]RZS74361.1 outer membrane protein assembly factor BamA [Pseudobacter ginsenosidimutans]
MMLGNSCIPTVKKAMIGKTFVYQTNIEIKGSMPGYKKRELVNKLQNQLDDSLKVRVVSWAGIVMNYVKPPIFDTTNIGRSKVFMTALLKANGFFQSNISDTFYFKTVNKRNRTYITLNVDPGVQLTIDSIGYALTTPELQQLALEYQNRSDLKKKAPYTTDVISTEIDRLLTSFRDNGYYKITRESVYAEVDTVVAALIDPTLDPFEQIQLLDSLRRKREKPTINVVFKQREPKDSTHLNKFYIGNVSVYPDLYLMEDTSDAKRDTTTIEQFKFFYNTRKFKLPFIAENISLRPGALYRQRRYYRTINNFNQLGPWQNVDLDLRERYDSVPLLDATLRLYPAKKQSITVDVEASRNVSDFLSNGRFFGIGLNFRLLDRNAYREAIQTSTNARFGIELGTNLVQTLQASFSHNIYFPKFILPWKQSSSREDRILSPRTVLSLEAGYTNRREFFQVPSMKASWGYEWISGRVRGSSETPRRRVNWQYIPLNFEYTSVRKTDSLRRLEKDISAYRFAFNDGMIISQVLSASTVTTRGKRTTLLRGRVEESGAIFGLIKNLELGDLRRYVKLDAEVKHYIDYGRSSLAFRAYGGVGLIYGKTTDTNGAIIREYNLPFFKAFSAGGPYSMRAWQIRRLGPGSATLYEPTDSTSAIDRFGNMQLEMNMEYRFNLTTIAGIKVASALFVDIGNIWSKEFDNTGKSIDDASFRLDRLYKDIAVGGGTSLRFDFDFFLIRLDWAYKLKNPVFANTNGGWFHKLEITSGQFQLGIGYPF